MPRRGSPPDAPPPFACEVCGVRFARQPKLDAHLLDVHRQRADFRLSPSGLDGVDGAVSRAVLAANEAFRAEAPAAREPVVCGRCPPGRRATFRNARGLAQHILSKHAGGELTRASAVSEMAPAEKGGPAVARGAGARGGRARKKRKEAPAGEGAAGGKKAKSETGVRGAKEEEKAHPSSGSKPPLSPKGAVSPRGDSPPAGAAAQAAAGSCGSASGGGERRSVPMDFSAIIGFTTNERKSYYRLPKR